MPNTVNVTSPYFTAFPSTGPCVLLGWLWRHGDWPEFAKVWGRQTPAPSGDMKWKEKSPVDNCTHRYRNERICSNTHTHVHSATHTHTNKAQNTIKYHTISLRHIPLGNWPRVFLAVLVKRPLRRYVWLHTTSQWKTFHRKFAKFQPFHRKPKIITEIPYLACVLHTAVYLPHIASEMPTFQKKACISALSKYTYAYFHNIAFSVNRLETGK